MKLKKLATVLLFVMGTFAGAQADTTSGGTTNNGTATTGTQGIINQGGYTTSSLIDYNTTSNSTSQVTTNSNKIGRAHV